VSLRFRLICLIAIVLIASLAVEGTIVSFNASRSVQTEMNSALQVGQQIVKSALAQLPESTDRGRDLEALVASPSDSGQLIERGRQVAEELGAHAPDKVKATLMTLLCRVEIRSDRVDITLSRCRLTQLLAGSISRLQSLWLRVTSAAPPAKKVNHEMAPERFS
jgi:hypothetical protein